HLEMVGFPDDEPLRVGKDAGPPTVRVRAYRYLIADPNARLGWRPMDWSDLTPTLVGGEVPKTPFGLFETIEGVSTMGSSGWHVDDVAIRSETLSAKVADARKQIETLKEKAGELEAQGRLRQKIVEPGIEPFADRWQVPDEAPGAWRPMKWGDLKALLNLQSSPDVASTQMLATPKVPGSGAPAGPMAEWPIGFVEARLALLEGELAPVRDTLERLNEVTERPSMGRTVRRLDTPGRVVLEYTGKTKTGDATLTAEQNNEFAGQVSD